MRANNPLLLCFSYEEQVAEKQEKAFRDDGN
jgi:hypothetical protein